jgi:hypothetical protein
MNLMAAYSDTDLNQARLMSRLSGKPAIVSDDIFMWNGILVDRASAVVALLKVYNQVPVSTLAKTKLHQTYIDKFADQESTVLRGDSRTNSDIWFYKICKAIKGNVAERSAEDVKNILISLHQR